ncbi:MAG: phage terminase large subunit [Methanobrevibacter sp.]|nr:phage terminase large subunit [Methanobrevibacter sp.]
MNVDNNTDWRKLWLQQRNHFKATIYNNKFIPQKPFGRQARFLIYPSEEAFYGGQAGGGKSSALLMSALQYVEEKHIPEGHDKLKYNALIIRRTLEDLDMPNAIMDRAKQWLLPKEDEGLLVWKDQKKRFIFNSGATLTFRYLSHNKHLNSYQGAELQFVGFDELTQFPENQYNYLHSRLRKLEDSDIPIRMRGASNPGGIGHDWVKKRFVDDNAKLPFIPSAYTDNKYLNQTEYSKQLDKLDELTRLQLKYGDWNAVLKSGLLVSRNQLNNAVISYQNTYNTWQPSFCTIGIDPASTGSDKFAMSCLVYFNNGNIVLVDLDSTPSAYPEELLRNFIIRNSHWRPYIINFEQEPGSDSAYALKHWQTILRDLVKKYGITVKNTQTSHSKYNRARPTANMIRQNRLFFDDRINSEKLRSLFNQYVYVHPDKEVMKEYPSPDELDSLGYAFMEIQKVIRL